LPSWRLCFVGNVLGVVGVCWGVGCFPLGTACLGP